MRIGCAQVLFARAASLALRVKERFLKVERGVHQALRDGGAVEAREMLGFGQQPGQQVKRAGENDHIIGHIEAFHCYNQAMSKREKLLQRAKNNQRNLRFEDFCTLMSYAGFVLRRISGSHHLYQHPQIDEVMNVQPMKDGLAKAYQVRQFLALMEAGRVQWKGEADDE